MILCAGRGWGDLFCTTAHACTTRDVVDRQIRNIEKRKPPGARLPTEEKQLNSFPPPPPSVAWAAPGQAPPNPTTWKPGMRLLSTVRSYEDAAQDVS
ncbi:hypothetical protein JHW43_002354 [Diplocarpon mali]|nr:hypothetical protein JHW43_002354 [Diplocarpon mali]